jgi:hypothetical protein
MEIKGSYPEGGSLGNHIVIQREIKSVREMEIKTKVRRHFYFSKDFSNPTLPLKRGSLLYCSRDNK